MDEVCLLIKERIFDRGSFIESLTSIESLVKNVNLQFINQKEKAIYWIAIALLNNFSTYPHSSGFALARNLNIVNARLDNIKTFRRYMKGYVIELEDALLVSDPTVHRDDTERRLSMLKFLLEVLTDG